MDPFAYAVIPVSIPCVIMNLCALVILFRTRNLNENRFNRLVVYLSISDAAIGLYILSLSFITFIESEVKEYVCSFVGTLSTATTLFSIYQVLLICFERLKATFSSPVIHLKRITSNRSVILGFVIFHLFPIGTWIYEIKTRTKLCIIQSSVVGIITLDIPAVAMITSIVVLYVLTIVRIKKHRKRITDQRQNYTASTASNRMKRNMITLGIIVLATVVIIAPRPIAAIIAFITGGSYPSNVVMICTYIIILNPIIDPIIYVFRINSFRRQLICCRNSQQIQIRVVQNIAFSSSPCTDPNTDKGIRLINVKSHAEHETEDL